MYFSTNVLNVFDLTLFYVRCPCCVTAKTDGTQWTNISQRSMLFERPVFNFWYSSHFVLIALCLQPHRYRILHEMNSPKQPTKHTRTNTLTRWKKPSENNIKIKWNSKTTSNLRAFHLLLLDKHKTTRFVLAKHYFISISPF